MADTAQKAQPHTVDQLDFIGCLQLLGRSWALLLALTLGIGGLGYAASFLIKPVFASTTSFIPPQQNQSSVAAALSNSLGSLASLTGAGSLRTPADQYVSMLQSATVSDRIIDRFGLQKVYEEQLRVDARLKLANRVNISVGKKDGMITIRVEDTDPNRAAEMANQYVEELRQLSSMLVLTESQQRRVFFEGQMKSARDQLITAQVALQASGFSSGALKVEPKAAAEGYARLKAEVTAAEVRLQAMRGSLADSTPEVRQLQATVTALRGQLLRLEQQGQEGSGPDYVSRYREFKYQETLFEMMARQFELARLDESREGALIQVVDRAQPAERKSKPLRGVMALLCATLALLIGSLALIVRAVRRAPAI